jgi:hypothetical protein
MITAEYSKMIQNKKADFQKIVDQIAIVMIESEAEIIITLVRVITKNKIIAKPIQPVIRWK